MRGGSFWSVDHEKAYQFWSGWEKRETAEVGWWPCSWETPQWGSFQLIRKDRLSLLNVRRMPLSGLPVPVPVQPLGVTNAIWVVYWRDLMLQAWSSKGLPVRVALVGMWTWHLGGPSHPESWGSLFLHVWAQLPTCCTPLLQWGTSECARQRIPAWLGTVSVQASLADSSSHAVTAHCLAPLSLPPPPSFPTPLLLYSLCQNK